MWPCRVALSLPQRHPTTCGLAPTINMSRQVTVSQHVTASHGVTARHGTRQVTVSQHVTEKRDVTGYQSRTEPPYPHLGRAGVETAFPRDDATDGSTIAFLRIVAF